MIHFIVSFPKKQKALCRSRAVAVELLCTIYVGIYSTMYLHSYLGKQCICQYQTAKQITQ